jgi:hypothetical protein
MSEQPTEAITCTCPEPEPWDGPGTAVVLPGKSHRRGCPVVAPIFDIMDASARRLADEHACRGGILPMPGEREAQRARDEVAELRRRVERLEAGQDNGSNREGA